MPLLIVQLPAVTVLGLHVTTGAPNVLLGEYPKEQEYVVLAFTLWFRKIGLEFGEVGAVMLLQYDDITAQIKQINPIPKENPESHN